MEPIFKTETIHDLTLYKEFQRCSRHCNPINNIAVFISSLSAACCISLMHYPTNMPYYFLGLSLFYLILFFLRNPKNGTVQYKRMLLENDGQPQHMVIHLNSDGIECTDFRNGNRYNYSYTHVRSLIDSPNLLLLTMSHNTCLILEKRWLKNGTVQELTDFLFSKCNNIRRKKLRKPTLGKWLNRILTGLLIAGSLWALANLPQISLWDKLTGKLHNDMSYRQMAQQLLDVDITISEQTIKELEAYDAQHAAEYGEDYYTSNPYASKVSDLLYWEGSGVYDEETWEWTPSTSGVFWFDTEVWNVDSIYTDFFSGLSAMNPELRFTDVHEDYSYADIEAGTGNVTVSFCYESVPYTLEADYLFDWFDSDILYEVGRILAADNKEKDLYISYNGQAIVLYYGTAAQIRKLERLTGSEIYDSVHMLLGH